MTFQSFVIYFCTLMLNKKGFIIKEIYRKAKKAGCDTEKEQLEAIFSEPTIKRKNGKNLAFLNEGWKDKRAHP